MTTIEQLGGLTTQHNEIIKRVVNGSLNPISVKRALQGIIESANKVPSFVERVEHQLKVWKKLGVAISDEQRTHILQQAKVFEPVTTSDEPLVTGGFGYATPGAVTKKLIEAFTSQYGYTAVIDIQYSKYRYVPDMKPTGELHLVHYDSDAYAGLSPAVAVKTARADKLRLAGIEVLEYLVLNPESGLMWDGELHYYPYLSGLQVNSYGGGWAMVPRLLRRDHTRQFKLASLWEHDSDNRWSSPVVREC